MNARIFVSTVMVMGLMSLAAIAGEKPGTPGPSRAISWEEMKGTRSPRGMRACSPHICAASRI